MNSIWTIIRPHFFWVVVISIGCVAFYEHEQAAKAEAKAQAIEDTSKVNIVSLQQQIAARNQGAQKSVQAIVVRENAVHIPAQAILALPDVSALPVAIRQLPGSSDYVLPAPDAVPLYDIFADDKKCGIELAACQGNYADQVKINTQQDLEVKAWKKAVKGTFWSRTWTVIKVAAPSIALGYLVGKGL